MADDHGAPKAEHSPGPGTEVVERQRVRSWTVQNQMRDVFGWMTAGAA